MSIINFQKLKSGSEINVLIDGFVIGRMTLFSPQYEKRIAGNFMDEQQHFISEPMVLDKKIVIGRLSVDGKKRKIYFKGKEVKLSAKDFDIIYLLASNKGDCVKRGEVASYVKVSIFSNALDVHMKNIRQKLDVIETVRGVGYRLKDL